MILRTEHIAKKFGTENVLQDISFALDAEHILSILGRSGCGKTTLLKIIAGLLREDTGEIFINEEKINNVPPHKRDIVYLYQEPLLFPHLNVFRNIAFGLEIRKTDKKQVEEKVMRMINDLQLKDQEKKMPHQLSGGQKQRVAFGRAAIVNPKILLLDEPFGNLDADTRAAMQELYKSLSAEYKISSLFVTHDLKEAVKMGDRYSYMRNGTLQLYNGLHEFIADDATGVKEEMEFWEKVKKS